MTRHLFLLSLPLSLCLFATMALGQGADCPDVQVVDDFEAYNDDCDLIFFSWQDGFGHGGADDCGVAPFAGNGSGSLVGNENAPFAEQRYVHGGNQALAMGYENAGTVLVSSAERQFATPRDLTAGGVMEVLKLWFQGRAGSAGSISENAGTYTVTGGGIAIGGFEDSFFYAYQALNGNVTVTARVDSLTAVKGKAGVMIRSGLETDDTHVSAFVTAEGRATFQFRIQKGGNTHITTSTAADAQWIRLTRTGDTFTGEYSSNGSTWQQILSDDPTDPGEITFPIVGDLSVGLALTAGGVGAPAEAVLSNLTITGGVSGALQESVEIGIVSNDPAMVSIGLEDTAGARVLVPHDAGDQAALVNYWMPWEIPFAAFAPVDLTSISKVIVSVGDDQAEGSGTLYVDDITTSRRLSMPWDLPLFSEDFEGLDLGPNIDESAPGDAVVTQTPPAAWTLDDSGVDKAGDPDHGVDEWEGWSFADKTWWATVDDQRRSQFARACGTVAVADSDEYDDRGDTGAYNAFMSTPPIDVLSVAAGENTLMLRFDSSWRPESSQGANITASFDGGSPIEILRWESSGDLFHDHETNESVSVTFGRPVGAQKVVLTFGYFDASNNWWWAVDNIELLGEPRIFLLRENFDSLPLGPNVEESIATEVVQAWTDTPPAGWFIDESGVPGIGNPATDGVTEWAGWAIADKQFWIDTDGQRREEFDNASGNVIVADNDEWDDDTHPGQDSDPVDPYDTWLVTPVLDISNIIPGTMKVSFDSSWRPEFDSWYQQSANITISYDGGEPIEVLRFESDPDSPFYKNDNSTNDFIEVELNNPPKAQTAQLTFGVFDAGNDWWWALDNIAVTGLPFEPIVAFTENFDGLTLTPSVEEDDAAPSDMAWTATPPEGWSIDNSGTPAGGTVEFDGWTFAAVDWWTQIGQERQLFTLASGNVAVADPDEWDDFFEGSGRMNSLLTTPVIDISNLGAGTAELSFDSSWRREDTQTAIVTVSYDGGEPIEILRWESEGADTGFVKDDAVNEQVVVAMNNPIGSQTAVVTFAMLEGGNDWWWAIDNVVVGGQPKSNAVRLLSEDFESVALGVSPEETIPAPQLVWSDDLPADWIRDNSAIPVDGEDNGVVEWLGWHVANKDWWAFVAGNQRRAEFALGEGAVLIADSDEWDDAPHPAGSYDAFIDTPAIDVSSAGSNLTLQFASSWRPEVNQTATITASFDGGAPVEILRWESPSGSPFFHDHLTSEAVSIDFAKPAGARNVVLTFGYFQSSNNWWWAVDNIELSSNGNQLFFEDFEGVALQLPVEEAQAPPPEEISAIWSNVAPSGWFNDTSLMPGFGDPATDGVADWAGWAFAKKDWWVEAAGDQQRSQFALGQGTVAVADPDEWDDAPHAEGLMNAFLISPIIEIPAEVLPATLRLKFDSSWRREDTQTAIITVAYDGGEPFEILRWESEGADTGFLKDDATNESVNVDLQTPEGATEMVITFGMVDAGNDWWWAIDHIEVVGEVAP